MKAQEMDGQRKIEIEEVTEVAPPPKARVSDAVENFERKKDYLAGFLAQKPAEPAPVEPDGDVCARFRVRMRELYESYKIVVQTLERLKPGPIKADAPKVVLPDRDDMRKHMDSLIHHFLIVAEGFNVPEGEVYHAIEGSKGELGCYLRSNGGPKPDRVHFRGPSFINLQALPVMSEGEMVADVVAIIGSLDIVLGEIDR